MAVGEYKYFKFAVEHEDANKLIRITAKAISNSSGRRGGGSGVSGLDSEYADVDICVSNRSDGLVATNLDTAYGYVWKSCNRRSSEIIEIHPYDTQRGPGGGVYVIGVLGCHQVG